MNKVIEELEEISAEIQRFIEYHAEPEFVPTYQENPMLYKVNIWNRENPYIALHCGGYFTTNITDLFKTDVMLDYFSDTYFYKCPECGYADYNEEEECISCEKQYDETFELLSAKEYFETLQPIELAEWYEMFIGFELFNNAVVDAVIEEHLCHYGDFYDEQRKILARIVSALECGNANDILIAFQCALAAVHHNGDIVKDYCGWDQDKIDSLRDGGFEAHYGEEVLDDLFEDYGF